MTKQQIIALGVMMLTNELALETIETGEKYGA